MNPYNFKTYSELFSFTTSTYNNPKFLNYLQTDLPCHLLGQNHLNLRRENYSLLYPTKLKSLDFGRLYYTNYNLF